MGIRRQFVLDKKTDRLVRDLAADSGGNRSRVIREAVRALAEREAIFEKIESDPKFIAMMERSEADIRAGRVSTLEEVEERLRRRRKSEERKRKAS